MGITVTEHGPVVVDQVALYEFLGDIIGDRTDGDGVRDATSEEFRDSTIWRALERQDIPSERTRQAIDICVDKGWLGVRRGDDGHMQYRMTESGIDAYRAVREANLIVKP